MVKRLLGTGKKRELRGIQLHIRDIVSTIAGLYLIFAVLYYPEPILHRALAFGLFYAVIFLSYSMPGAKDNENIPVHDWIMAALCIGIAIYIALNIQRITARMEFYDPVELFDIITGLLTITLLIEGTRRVIGHWLISLVLIALAYLFWGHFIPGRYGHEQFSLSYIIDGLFLTRYGIWGTTIGIAAGKVMVFLMFGTLFKNTGAGDFLFDFIARIAGRSRAGVAKISILSSAMFGMVSGGPLTNATTTGAMTIPAMKKGGFTGEYAACVESCASVGGIFMPPVMGAVAFLMSEVVGIQYAELIKRAILPAIVYFTALIFAVDFHARKNGIKGIFKSGGERMTKLLIRGYNFFIPITYLVVRLSMGRSVSKAGLETIAVMLVLGLFNKKRKMNFSLVAGSLKTSVNRGVLVFSTLAACGLLVGIIDITGITAKFTSTLMHVADISLILTLLAVMLVTLFLGLAMNISSSYLIAAVLGAPVLIGLGFNTLGVHMFILFYAAMATITPPVAMTSFAAASIADASPMKVGFLSMKVGMVAYILPFVFIYNPAILLYGSVFEVLFALAAAIMGTAVLAMGLEGWFFNLKTGLVLRTLLILSGIIIVLGEPVLMLLAVLALGSFSGYHALKNTQYKKRLEGMENEKI